MLLPDNFVFSQQNLQDYVDCQYRFFLRYLQKLEWPAVESEPIREQEELMLLGTRFHLLCQQYFSGIPAEMLTAQITHPSLITWWQNFLLLKLDPQSGFGKVEKLVSMPFSGFRLAAKFDLLFIDNNQNLTLYDWKTSQHQPKRQTLLERMQSKVYPLVAAHFPLPNNVSPDLIEMIYWYPAFPTLPIRFTYSSSQLETDQAQLSSLINEIIHKKESDFVKTDREKICSFCRYRSLCNRGQIAGTRDELDELINDAAAFSLDFDAL